MDKDIYDEVIEAIVSETISVIPAQLYQYYKNLPGRRPSDLHKRISSVIMHLDEDIANELIRDIVDSSVFSILYLIDNNFKNKLIRTSFTRSLENVVETDSNLIERYRLKVKPGGVV